MKPATGPSIEIIEATATLEYGRIAGFVRDDFATFSTFQNLSFDGGAVHGSNDFPIIKNVFINGSKVTGSDRMSTSTTPSNDVTNSNALNGIHVDATTPAQNPPALTVTIKSTNVVCRAVQLKVPG